MIVRDDLPPDVVQDEAQPVGELLQGITAPHALAEETCRAVASRMAALGLQRLPVVESEQSQKLLGVVSRSDLLKPARQLHEEESRSEEHTSELQSLMRISYAVFCLKKKKKKTSM